MSGASRREYLRAIHARYRAAGREQRRIILDEFCHTCGYHRKYAIRLLNAPAPQTRPKPRRRRRAVQYSSALISILAAVWEAAGYPWSVRLKALLPLWMPQLRVRYQISPAQERQLLQISPRQIDRRLRERKGRLRKRLYGHTKPGTLLKHQVPIKTEHWDVALPGFVELDLVSHSGNSAHGEFIYSLNLTDIHTAWVETRAVMGKGQHGVVKALEQIRKELPFGLSGIDSDNGSEFINAHLLRYCRGHHIAFTRGRPYKKDDNAHVEQKNWTHVRRILGYARFDSPEALYAINDLYRHELRLLQNLFLPAIKLKSKTRVGSRTRRCYDQPSTPLDRVIASKVLNPEQRASWISLRESLDPFALSASIERKVERILHMANLPKSPPRTPISTLPRPK